ncbi:MAG: jacalin-like lectin [Pseudomonadota bacterium]
MQSITLKLGPLGKTRIKFESRTDIDVNRQEIGMRGNFMGQAVSVVMGPTDLAIDVSASCVNPFEIKAKAAIHPTLDIAQVFDVQPGVNVDPSKIGGCIGTELEAALNKIAGEYSSLSGYSAREANKALKQMTGFGSKTYEQAKDGARDVANKATHSSAKAFNDAGNAFKKLGKKKKHKKGPDPKFAASVFDWDYYYDNNPDVVDAKVDLSTHWRDNGFNEGRQGSPEFSAIYYWNRYTDVQAKCPNRNLQCALQHWLDFGFDDGRQGSATFSIESYLNRYPDLQRAFGKYNYDDAFDHWFNNGEGEGRDGSPASSFNGPVSGPMRAGGGGGSEWSDADFCAGQYVTGFRINNGKKTVDRLQFKYPQGWAPSRGGSKGFNAEVNLAPGEYFVRAETRSGDRVDSVTFWSNLGKVYGPFGGGGAGISTYTVTPGEKLGCMAGRNGKSIDQLIFSSTGPR